jgi:drug/metabolite transporter (DMT)-like permease
MALAVALALVAAFLIALGTVLEERVAARSSGADAARAGFLLRLARRPQWLLGIAFDVAAFVCQAAALAAGGLVLVQPLLATNVVFALPLGAWLTDAEIGRRQVIGAVTVTVGLAMFVVVVDASGGENDASATGWLVSFAVIGAVSAALIVAARGRRPRLRAGLLGAASGMLYGLSAAVMKATVERFDAGVWAVVVDWRLYALIALLYASMAVSQMALQTGRLALAVSSLTALDPITSVVLGVLAFGERIHESSLGVVSTVGALAVMVGGLAILAAQPAVAARAYWPGRGTSRWHPLL